MKKATKKILAFLLAAMITLPVIPAMTVAAADYEQTIRVNQLTGNTNIRSIMVDRDAEALGKPGTPASGNFARYWDNGGSNSSTGADRFILFTITGVPENGRYELAFYWYTRGDGPGSVNRRKMSINGGNTINLDFSPTSPGVWEYFTYIANLTEGTNTVRLWFDNTANMNSWLFLDHLKVTDYTGEADAAKFRLSYADILALTASSLNITHKAGINAAITAYNGLTAEAKALLAAPEKALLDDLMAQIAYLESLRDVYISNFGHERVLALTVFTVKASDKTDVSAALADYGELDSNGKTLLITEKNLLDALLARILKLEAGDTADVMMEDWLAVYLKTRTNGEYSTYGWSNRSNVSSNDGDETGMWHGANVYDLFNDAYEYSADQAYKALMKSYMDGYYKRVTNGSFSWSGTFNNNGFTDDILWWSNAFTRTFMLTGDTTFLTEGERVFNRAYDRAWDIRAAQPSSALIFNRYQGGLLWNYTTSGTWTPGVSTNYPSTNEKNVATNGNGCINAARLARIYKGGLGVAANPAKGADYETKAANIYNWMYTAMLHTTGVYANTGRLYDNHHSSAATGTRDWQFSYNYGLFAGAAYEMWLLTGDAKYIDHINRVLGYGWATLTEEDGLTFNTEADMGGGDGAAFRLVLTRYTAEIIKSPEFEGFKKYIYANAYQTFTNRRLSDGLIGSSSAFPTDNAARIPSTVAAFGPQVQWYANAAGFELNYDYPWKQDLVVWKMGYNTLAEALGGKIANTAPIFISGGTGFGATEGPDRLFDYTTTGGTGNQPGTGTKYGGNAPYWAEWAYPAPFAATRFVICTANDNFSWPRRMGDGWTLSGSSDGVNWNVIYTGSKKDYSNYNRMFYAFDLDNDTAYQYYRLYSAESGDSGGSVQLSMAVLASDSPVQTYSAAIANNSFETPALSAGQSLNGANQRRSYGRTGTPAAWQWSNATPALTHTGWTYTGDSGIQRACAAYAYPTTAALPNSTAAGTFLAVPQGSQTAYIVNGGAVSQDVIFPADGLYSLTFSAAPAYLRNAAALTTRSGTLRVSIGDTAAGTYSFANETAFAGKVAPAAYFAAGTYTLKFECTEGGVLLDNVNLAYITVDPETPDITVQPQDAEYVIDEPAEALSVTAGVSDGGLLSYQWYKNDTGSSTGGILIEYATDSAYTPDTSAAGTAYYYCVVSNSNEYKTSSIASDTAEVAVIKIEFECTVKTIAANVGTAQQIAYSYSGPDSGRPTFTSSNAAICAVDGEGNLTPVKAGMAIITVKCNGMTVTIVVTVK